MEPSSKAELNAWKTTTIVSSIQMNSGWSNLVPHKVDFHGFIFHNIITYTSDEVP